MPEAQRIKTKVCLVGEAAVGKTSLIRRFVQDEFDDRYITTLGAKVSKREMAFEAQDRTKIDLKDEVMILYGDKEIQQAVRAFEAPYFYASAKTGENVEILFRRLGTMVLQREGIAVAT